MGLPPARASALSVLVFGGARTVSELAAAEQVSRPTMTRLVQGLARTGLVTCTPDPKDGRVVRVAPTARGTKLLDEGRRHRIDALTRLLASLPEGEMESLAAATKILAVLVAAPDPSSETAARSSRRLARGSPGNDHAR